MQAPYQVPDRPTSPPEPTCAELLSAFEERQYAEMRHQHHMDELRRCLVKGEHVRVGIRVDHVSRFIPDTCDYSDTEEAAWALEERAATGCEPASIGKAYINLLELRLVHAAEEMVRAEGEGKRVEYGVTQ